MPGVTSHRDLCYPHPLGAASHVSRGWGLHRTGLHETAGLPGYWALDFMAGGGTPILAPEDGEIFKLSGHDPSLGDVGGGVFGWSTYLLTPDGVRYYYTHQGERLVTVGQNVKRGHRIGTVGHWPNDEPRSHTHAGVLHPAGVAASERAALNLGDAPRFPL